MFGVVKGKRVEWRGLFIPYSILLNLSRGKGEGGEGGKNQMAHRGDYSERGEGRVLNTTFSINSNRGRRRRLTFRGQKNGIREGAIWVSYSSTPKRRERGAAIQKEGGREGGGPFSVIVCTARGENQDR